MLLRTPLLLAALSLIALLSGCGTSADSDATRSSSNNYSLGSSGSGSSSWGNQDTNQGAQDSDNGGSSSNNQNTGGTNQGADNNDSGFVFDDSQAIYDAKACGAFDDYSALIDSSLDPEGREDSQNGIMIYSTYRFSFVPSETQVILFYPHLNATKKGKPYVSLYTSNYTIAFDKGWVDNDNKRVYIQTPKIGDQKSECYRYTLNDANTENIVATKVYR